MGENTFLLTYIEYVEILSQHAFYNLQDTYYLVFFFIVFVLVTHTHTEEYLTDSSRTLVMF